MFECIVPWYCCCVSYCYIPWKAWKINPFLWSVLHPKFSIRFLFVFNVKRAAPWGQHGLASGADRTAQRRLAQRFLPQPLRGFRAAAAAGAAGSGWAIGAEAGGGRGDRGAASRFFREGKQPVYAKFVMYGDNFYVTTDNFHGKKKNVNRCLWNDPLKTQTSMSDAQLQRCSAI